MDKHQQPGPDAPAAQSPHPHTPAWAPPSAVQAPAGASPVTSIAAPPQPMPVQPPPPTAAYSGAPAPQAPTFRSWQPGIIALRPLSFGDFLAAPFKAMRFNRSVILGGPLMFTLAATALSVTSLWLLFNDPQLGLLSTSTVPAGITTQTVVVGLLALIAVLMADVLSSTIIAPGVARAVLGERITLRAAWDQVRGKLWQVLLLYLVTAVAISAVIVLAAVPMIIAIATDSTLWIVLGTLLVVAVLVPVTFIVTLITGLARPIIVLERVSAMKALGRSWRLMKGRFWWSVLIIFVTAVLINIATSFLQGGAQILSTVALLAAPGNETAALIVGFAIYGLAMVVSFVVTYAYIGSVFTLMYTDMRMRHEGFDLDLARAAEARGRR